MTIIYDQHKAAFANVSAYVIAKDGERVATIAFKYPRDGAGRLMAYVHFLGAPMARGFASGCGYDKHSAAVSAAVQKAAKEADKLGDVSVWAPFSAAVWADGGSYWDSRLRDAGFDVWAAV